MLLIKLKRGLLVRLYDLIIIENYDKLGKKVKEKNIKNKMGNFINNTFKKNQKRNSMTQIEEEKNK